MNALTEQIVKITELCEKHYVTRLYVFGSLVTGNMAFGSDIDLLVDFNNMPLESYADNYFDLQFALEELLGCRVDLLEAKAIKNPFLLQNIHDSRKLVYER